MAISQSEVVVERTQLLSHDRDLRLTLPETTMVIIASSGAIWAVILGALNAFLS